MNECGSTVPSLDIRQARIENDKGQIFFSLNETASSGTGQGALNINLALTINW